MPTSSAEGLRMVETMMTTKSEATPPADAPTRNTDLLEEQIRLLLEMRRHLRIAHHIPGRLRVRAGIGLLEVARKWRGRRFGPGEAIRLIHGIRNVRVNSAAGSAVIEYDAARVPPEAWHRLLDGHDAEALGILHDHVPGLDEHLENDQTANVEGGRAIDE